MSETESQAGSATQAVEPKEPASPTARSQVPAAASRAPESVNPSTPQRPVRAIVAVIGLLVVFLVAAWLTSSWWLEPTSLEAVEQLVEREQWAKGERHVRRYLTRRPDDPAAQMLLARILGGRGAVVECARVLEGISPDSALRGEALLRSSQAWMEARRPRESERVARACLDLSPGDLELPLIQQQCRRHLCGIYAVERRRAEFWAMVWQMYEHAAPPQRHESLATGARYEFEMVEPAVALAGLELALRHDPDDLFTRRAVGLYQLAAGQRDQARAQLYQCVQRRPDDPSMCEAWLNCLHVTGDLFGLSEAVRQLPATADRSAECWNFRAIVAERENSLIEAVEHARRAVELDPTNAELCHRLGQLLIRVDQRAEGETQLTRGQELEEARVELRDAFAAYRARWRSQSDERAELAHRLGLANERAGRSAEAVAWYRAALSEDPVHQPSIAALQSP